MTSRQRETQRRARFEEISRELRPDLFRYAFWLGRDSGLAEDVVQETLLRGWKSLDRLRDKGSAKQWLMTILRREFARHFERKRLETRNIDELSAAEQGLLADRDNSDIAALRAEIFTLDDDYREPLVLQVLMGHSTDEIAELMDISNAAVLTRLFRARKMLRKKFENESRDR